MMNKLLSIVAFISTFCQIDCFCQNWNWADSYGNLGSIHANYIHDIKTTSDSMLLISGNIGDTVIFSNDTLIPVNTTTLGYIGKFDKFGNPVWVKDFHINSGSTLYPTFPMYISLNMDNTFYLSSHFHGSVVLGNDTLYEYKGETFVSLLDSAGNFIWAKNFGDSNSPGSNVVQLGKNYSDSDNNLYVTGTFRDSAFFETEVLYRQSGGIFVAKFDQAGNELWVRQCGQSKLWERAYDISGDENGNVYITGTLTDTAWFGNSTVFAYSNGGKSYIAKIDSSGNFQWVRTGGEINIIPNSSFVSQCVGSSVRANNNGVYYTGSFLDTAYFGNLMILPNCGQMCYGLFVASYDLQGNVNWVVQSPVGTPSSFGLEMELDREGNIYAAGKFNNFLAFDSFQVSSTVSTTDRDLYIAKFDSSGTCLGLINPDIKVSVFDLEIDCRIPDIIIGSNYSGSGGNLSALGVTPTLYEQNIFLAGVFNNLNCVPVGISENILNDLQVIFYPNPSDGNFNIQIQINSRDYEYFLRIYDYSGRELENIQLYGNSTMINKSNLNSGLYYAILSDFDGCQIHYTKFTVIK